MTIVMKGIPAGGDSPQDNAQQQQVPQQSSQINQPITTQPAPNPLPQQMSSLPQQSSTESQSSTGQSAAPPSSQTTSSPSPLLSGSSPTNQSLTVAIEEGGQGDGNATAVPVNPDQEPEFPHVELARLDEMINRPRWVVPVLPKGELELLLEASIKLCKEGLDIRSEACQRFFREGLTISFTKILTDEAVSGWKYEIHKCILKNAEKLIELCVAKLSQDWFPLLELLAMVLNPQCKFHTYNASRQSETMAAVSGNQVPEDALFARPPDQRTPRGWLVDLVNRFGQLDGFQILLDRFTKGPPLSVPVVASLIKPFGLCAEVLTTHTIQKYFVPIVDIVPEFLDKLTDDELKKESKTEAKNDALSSIIKALKQLVSRLPNQEEKIKWLEIFRLKMILRLLQISSFNGKMNALNEVNKVITNVSFHASRHSQLEEDEWLTAEKVAEWIQQNNVLSIVLRDSLHQPQYVEKLEKILRFMIKEKALTMDDLDRLWEAQSGKHDAIVKNVHDLLAKLAWDFTPEQLDHLFECFQGSWNNASKKQREKLLELIRRLAEDDKEGVMAHKVLTLLWNLAHSDDVPTEIMDQALTAHIKILDYSCSQDRDAQKIQWISRFVDELKNDKWVLPSLKQIREICQLFPEAPQNFPHTQRAPHMYYRNNVIGQLQNQHSIVMLVSQNLSAYMNKARAYSRDHPGEDPSSILPDGRFHHIAQVQERLRFLRFLLKDGQLWLCEPQARQIWHSLAENAIYISDREACFKWFAKLMGEEPDLDPDITRDFFERNILQLDPSLLTENGINCFERFFKQVNLKENKLIAKRRGGYLMDDMELVGLDYLWRVVLLAPDEVAEKAVILLKDIFTNLGPRLQQNQVEIHEDFIGSCIDRLKALFDTVSVLEKDHESTSRVMQETIRMVRILNVLKEYVAECDEAYGEERVILPLSRACRGKLVTLKVRFPNQGRQVEDIEIWSHHNETVGAVRRHILQRLKANANVKVDLYINGEQIDASEDKKLISQIPLRDKTVSDHFGCFQTLTAKLVQMGSNMASSPDSSSDSSVGSPHNQYEGPNVEAESCLPGVLMSQNSRYSQFLFQLSDLGCQLQVPRLRDSARAVLKLMPADAHTMEKLRNVCRENNRVDGSIAPGLEAMLFNNSPTQVLYNVEVTYCLLMPAIEPLSEEAFEFQFNFVRSGGVQLALNMLTKNNFLSNADLPTRRTAYLTVLKICKLMLTTVGHARVQVVVDACNSESQVPAVSVAEHNQAAALQQALHYIPAPESEFTTRGVATRLGQHMGEQAAFVLPDLNTVKAIQKIAWAASSCSLHLVHTSVEDIHRAHEKPKEAIQTDMEDISVAREALETLAVCLALCPSAFDALHKDKGWQCFIIDLLLLCRTKSVRICASEQFFLMATRCTSSHVPLIFLITLLFTVLQTTAKDNAKQSHEYFSLLCRLLSYAGASEAQLATAETLLNNEITWLKKVRDQVLKTGEVQVEEALLEGHLGITRELLAFTSPEKKFNIGSENGGADLVRELVEDFIFPASKIVLQCRKSQGEFPAEQKVAVCSSPLTVIAAFDLLVALCTGCVHNLEFLAAMLIEMYYTNETPLSEWEYVPPVGPRPPRGFVGLKNAGATCYMNSVLQQLFMIESLRRGILAVDGAADNIEEELLNDEKPENETNIDSNEEEHKDEEKGSRDEERKDYNLGVLKQVQVIFGHLAASKLQYFVPRGFWKHFKLWGEPVNLREQHDALEFFNSLVDSLDEALKSLSQPTLLAQHLGGSFADQKICKDCPHRYQREEAFTTLNVDIRNHQNLFESLEQYVKGDLLEGANAYRCEKCDKKVDTVKRLVIRKLPKILAIQLKRFDYDWERECAIKFNDYFEFPREFDMEPYTVQGLAKIEGEIIDDDLEAMTVTSTKYRLIGVVVHSGQASGGHYYSYIFHRGQHDAHPKWYKFDDGDVSECKMDDDEEMKNQCFGGEYLGEVYDHMLKRSAFRRQKRWWNAYILFYERIDEVKEDLSKDIQKLSINESSTELKMPVAIERCVRRQNVLFMHEKNQFSVEYFQFMKKLLTCNHYLINHALQEKMTPDVEQISLTSIKLGCKFLFNVGFHTKKSFRGPAGDWYDALHMHIRCSPGVRSWMAHNVLFNHPSRFAEYLLECPSSEVRSAFAKIIVIVAHVSLQDGPCPPPLIQGLYTNQPADPNATLSDHILSAVLALLRKEVSEHGRHLQQYFNLFLMYLNLGVQEKMQLLRLTVPALFMLVALDEGPGPPIKYQYAELSKLYSVVSHLVRCCDVSHRCQSSIANQPPLANNPFADSHCPQPLMPIQPPVEDILFARTIYVKKLIEECNNTEDTAKLLKFCSWENPHFSSTVLSELLWQVAYSYTYELRPYLDLLLQMLMIEDSWQNHRIHNALKGIPDDRDGLFDTIQRSKNHYQKRAYQCIKMMVSLFTHCAPAATMLQVNGDLKRKWTCAVDWLNDELERRPYPGNTQYAYNNWSPPAQSNETSNGYFLERSQSAKVTLAKAFELCPDEEQEEVEMGEDHDVPAEDSSVPTYLSQQQQQQQPAGGSQQHQQSSNQQQSQRQSSSTQQQQPSQPSSQANQNQLTGTLPSMQNNQVHVQGSGQPAQPPCNQINNQLNQNQKQPIENSETGEEEEIPSAPPVPQSSNSD
ncbi:LOW QUALITY PROTEIN: probable ubiquitin carboxyl-terminal hydrolase FAF-X [Pomacea canaliculata]|uniref:LOW QUALITY PROTEIN: probable ubiquitin carboxyl-terminal hydrolase FAF-X n=1 Tax=Pomacea canaliculata TaxID=400727 RepID=UPI000D734046|nr:LOW QUALITY PROTEIN: probable ubiquitin carboxyl-terminal hydrolase FAF-X [Pomacea canaliculata]